MAHYQAKICIAYNIDAKNEAEAEMQLVGLISEDWPKYIETAEITKIEKLRKILI